MLGLYVFCLVMGSVILGLQLMGGVFDFDSGHHDVTLDKETGHVDHGDRGSSLNLLSIRGLSAGVTIFGAFGGMFTSLGWTPVAAFFGAGFAGLGAHVGVSYLIMKMAALSAPGKLDVTKAVGKTATVYQSFDHVTGRGKVQVSVQGEIVELAAISKYGLVGGDRVMITDMVGGIAYVSPLQLT